MIPRKLNLCKKNEPAIPTSFLSDIPVESFYKRLKSAYFEE